MMDIRFDIYDLDAKKESKVVVNTLLEALKKNHELKRENYTGAKRTIYDAWLTDLDNGIALKLKFDDLMMF